MTEIPLGRIAHARAGDKGDSSILFVAPDEPGDFPELMRVLTPARLAAHFAIEDPSAIRVRSLDGLAAFSIVIPHRLDGGVTRSVTIDPHGKTLSGHLLDLRVPWTGDIGPAV